MTVGMAAAIQNRLFWRASAGEASERSVLSAGQKLGISRWTVMCCQLSSVCGALYFCVAVTSVVLSAAPFAAPAEAANVWSEPTYAEPRVYIPSAITS